MTTQQYETGTTIRVRTIFRELVPVDSNVVGAVVDPSIVRVRTFDAERNVLSEQDSANDPSIVVKNADIVDAPYYYYDWRIPLEEGNYFIEFEGVVSGDPIIIRQKIKAKWDVA